MYIEASSRSINDTARFISPIYDKMNESNVCLEFYYHMYGSSTGQLRVYIKKLSESWDLQPRSAIFWRAGNHGDRWLRSLHQIGPIEEDFQVYFVRMFCEFSRKYNFRSSSRVFEARATSAT